jgi:hypothetical protein
MATLRHHPPRRWPWVLWTLLRRKGRPGTYEAYLAPNERVLSVTSRHPVALASPFFVWLGVLMIGLASGVSYNEATGTTELSYVGAGIILSGSVLLGWKVWRWRTARYVLTDHRLMYMEGIVSRRVTGLPLRSVLDTTFHQTVMGRIFGYGDIEVNLSGHPGLRRLTRLARPATLYYSILSLTAVRDVTERAPPDIPDAGGGPDP